jgi:stage II sporulation protein AA (anti-sigma F factor antagonist)
MWIAGVGTAVVVHAGGNLTVGNRKDLQALVLDALARGERDVAVDLEGAEYIDTAALGTLVMLANRVREAGGALHLEQVSTGVRAVLALTQLDGTLLDGIPLPGAAGATARAG